MYFHSVVDLPHSSKKTLPLLLSNQPPPPNKKKTQPFSLALITRGAIQLGIRYSIAGYGCLHVDLVNLDNVPV